MCLVRIFTDEEMEEWLADRPEVMVLEKGVSVYADGYGNLHSECSFGCRFSEGLNTTKPKRTVRVGKEQRYWPYYHFYEKAPRWMEHCGNIIIKCLVRKSQVCVIGEDSGGIAIVASQAVFPHYPETEARYEDLPQENQYAIELFERMARDTK